MNTQSLSLEQKLKIEGYIYFALFIGSIFLANYIFRVWGTTCNEEICFVPVWPGILAPSGVIIIGLSFTLRDLVQRRLGLKAAMLGIVVGAGLSAMLEPALALASGAAFFFSELLDLFVYTPLQKRNLIIAVIASNLVGLTMDSTLFLWLAFDSLEFLNGQIIGKIWMTFLALPAIWWLRQWDAKRGVVVDDD